ncbi:MAG: hypothetical protein AAGA45_02315 [Verrucomicrobiota bacterium]
MSPSTVLLTCFCLIMIGGAPALPATETAEEPMTLQDVLAEYFAAQGGIEHLETVNSLRMIGTLTIGDREMEIIQIKKRPNLMRMTVKTENGDLIQGFNGNTAWRTLRQREQAIELEGREREELIRNAYLFSQIYQPDDNNVTLSYLGMQEVRGEPAHTVVVELDDGSKMTHYIDPETYLDNLIISETMVDGVPIIIESVYSNIQTVKEMQLPYKVENFMDGELQSSIELETIEINPGIHSPYFDPPGGIEPKGQTDTP